MADALSVTGTDTITNGSESSSFNNLISGSARAWANFNGDGTVAIRDSYNINSLVDNGTGDYTLNFTIDFANDDYCGVTLAGEEATTLRWAYGPCAVSAVGSYEIHARTTAFALTDLPVVQAVFFGDQ